MKATYQRLTHGETDQVIRLAWEDRASFERIEKQTGLTEADVIQVMRRELKPRSFKLWRERVSGRVTKHRKRFKLFDGHKGSFE